MLRGIKKPETPNGAAITTWNWCEHFVSKFNLCPWASASLHAKGAIQLNIIQSIHSSSITNQRHEECGTMNLFEDTIRTVAEAFCQKLQDNRLDPNTAIAFVVLDDQLEFGVFYEWFVDFEENWLARADGNPETIENKIVLASFHPDWSYAGEKDDPISFEKRSPFPTVTVVSAAVIDKAGDAATKQIAIHNAEVLQANSIAHWNDVFDKAIYHREVPTYTDDRLPAAPTSS
jgi:hypothetical protein